LKNLLSHNKVMTIPKLISSTYLPIKMTIVINLDATDSRNPMQIINAITIVAKAFQMTKDEVGLLFNQAKAPNDQKS